MQPPPTQAHLCTAYELLKRKTGSWCLLTGRKEVLLSPGWHRGSVRGSWAGFQALVAPLVRAQLTKYLLPDFNTHSLRTFYIVSAKYQLAGDSHFRHFRGRAMEL